MKVLITVATYSPDKNGVQYVTQYQAEGLVKLGHEVTVVTSDHNGKYKMYEIINGVKIIRLNAANKNMFHRGNKKIFQKKTISIANQCNVMINVCLQSFAADWVLPIIDKIECRKILIMHSMHNFTWTLADKNSFSNLIKKILRDLRWRFFYTKEWTNIIKYDNIIHLHEKDISKVFFQNRGYNYNEVIYNAIDRNFFIDCNKTNQIISVASYNSRKNQLLALKIFYLADTKDYKMLFIGMPDNNYYYKMLEMKKEYDSKYGFKNVEILVNVDREKTISEIKNSKIYFMSSTWEGFPISVIEALATGAAYLSTNVGIVNEIPGGIVAESEENLVKSLSNLISGDWITLGEIGKNYVAANMNQDVVVKKLEKVIRKREM